MSEIPKIPPPNVGPKGGRAKGVRTRKKNGKRKPSLDTELRRAKAVEMRAANYTLRQIADELGVCKSTVLEEYIRPAMREALDAKTGASAALLERHLAMVDELIEIYRVKMVDDSKAAMVLLKAFDQSAKLLGLYAPTKHDIGGSDAIFLTRDQKEAAVRDRIATLLVASEN
jgi:hypothetical protein